MIQRRTYLKRSTKPLKRSPLIRKAYQIPRISKRRRRERGQYDGQRQDYILAHPYCQIWIARWRVKEDDVIAGSGRVMVDGEMMDCPLAGEIHHRNKARGARLTDERWWLSASRSGHDWVEDDKDSARAAGFLLPLEADADGRHPSGNVSLTSPAFIAARAAGADAFSAASAGGA